MTGGRGVKTFPKRCDVTFEWSLRGSNHVIKIVYCFISWFVSKFLKKSRFFKTTKNWYLIYIGYGGLKKVYFIILLSFRGSNNLNRIRLIKISYIFRMTIGLNFQRKSRFSQHLKIGTQPILSIAN